MLQRSNSRLAPRGRQRLVELVRAGESVSAVAREAGVSRQTAHKWIARAEAGELLSDRPSRPLSLRRPPRLGQAPQRLRGSPADISYLRCRQRHGTQQLASDGLEVTSGNCFSDELFAQVISIIPESCRLFSPVRPGLARWRSRFGPAPRASDYSSRSFPQVGWAAGVYRLPAAVTGMGGANRVLSPVPAGTRVPGAFRALGNKRKRR